ncbi:perlucin-like [Mercenaria mercenaria]|uniref:perlucin-like n=1 Tax=Mercenaria mercenaria TaxID=6596 RepID=UPI00234F342C|nr:perlucin-like [Mercenaria mercenaria]
MGILYTLLLVSAIYSAEGAYCKDGYSSHGEYCYALLPLKASWAEAQQYCKTLGGSLAVIEDADESNFVEGMLKREHSTISTSQIWIGGTDLLQEGLWIAPETLEPLTFFNWAPKEPDNLGGQHCLAVFNNADLKWDDNRCEVQNYALCKSEGVTNENIVG